jgi:hypothetical protein
MIRTEFAAKPASVRSARKRRTRAGSGIATEQSRDSAPICTRTA